MSLHPNRDALRHALQSSLSDVLLDLGMEGRGPRPPIRSCPSAANFALQRAESSAAAGISGTFDSPFLQSRQQSFVSQSLGLSLPAFASLGQNCGQTGTTGIGADGILLAAAAASERSKLLEQAKASLIQQHIVEENKRLLFQQSYLDLLQKGFPSQKAEPTIFPQLVTRPPEPQVASRPIPGEKALEALGSSLRTKTDPYIDVSELADPDPEDSALRRTRGGVSEPFPEKLHRMLREVEGQGFSDVVSFFSHGRAFGVHDMDRFVSEVMPKYFKQSKWNSFARQLNLYGFIRITSGPDAGGYYHELFLKGRPNLCLHMRRVGVPQGEDRRKFRPKNKNVEPDFYSMKRVSTTSA